MKHSKISIILYIFLILLIFTDLIEFKSGGLFNLLDEESKLPKSSAEHFTESVFARWPSHFRLCKPRTSRLKAHRELRDDEGFLIRHFAGAVCYSTVRYIITKLKFYLNIGIDIIFARDYAMHIH